MNARIEIIISQCRGGDPRRRKLEEELAAELASRADVRVTVMPHLYDLAPDGPAVRHLQSTAGPMILLGWSYPRAAYWILKANRVAGRAGRTSFDAADEADAPGADADSAVEDVPERTIWCIDLGGNDQVGPYLEEIDRIAAEAIEATGRRAGAAPRTKPLRMEETTQARWYPVIDFGRCTDCLECLNFCLFGVFSTGEGDSILIEQPDACRDGCPACSRICPQGAIMFPEHNDPAIAGDPAASLEGLKLDLSQLFGGLNPAETAAAERDRALTDKERTEAEGSRSDDELDRLVDELDDMEL